MSIYFLINWIAHDYGRFPFIYYNNIFVCPLCELTPQSFPKDFLFRLWTSCLSQTPYFLIPFFKGRLFVIYLSGLYSLVPWTGDWVVCLLCVGLEVELTVSLSLVVPNSYLKFPSLTVVFLIIYSDLSIRLRSRFTGAINSQT